MSGSTTKLGIYLIGGGLSGTYGPDEQVNVDLINQGFEKIDASFGVIICTSTTRPASPVVGQSIYETDTKNTLFWSGTRWVPTGIPRAATDALRLALFPAPVSGDRVFRTDTKQEQVYSGTAWISTVTEGNVATFGANWSVTPGAGHVPRLHLANGLVTLTGAMTLNAGAFPTNIMTVPAAYQPANTSTRFIGSGVNSEGVAYALTISAGVIGIPTGYNGASLIQGAVHSVASSWAMD